MKPYQSTNSFSIHCLPLIYQIIPSILLRKGFRDTNNLITGKEIAIFNQLSILFDNKITSMGQEDTCALAWEKSTYISNNI